MPYRCSVPACRGNYDENNKVCLFSFPKDQALREKWISAIPRKEFLKYTKHSKVCERHFLNDDIEWISPAFDEKKGCMISARLERPKLKKGAIPVIFKECPKNLSKDQTAKRISSSNKRITKEDATVARVLKESQEECMKSVLLKMKGKGKNINVTKIKLEIESDSLTTEFNPSNLFRDLTCISELQRKNVEDINLQDLKDVQFQLEDILVHATKRKRQLEENISSLETLSAKKNKRSRSTDSAEKKTSEERPPKKVKESNSKSHVPSATSQPKGKFIQTHYVDVHMDVPKVQKNDGPSRFWTFLEPYCAEITQDTIRAIEDWINSQNNNEKYERIPELGTHFASKWPLEDMKEEMKEGSKSVENNKGLFTDSAEENVEIERVINLGYNECSSSNDEEYNSLINRIVYSLVGENLMTFLDDTMTEVCNGDAVRNGRLNLPQTSNNNADTLEKRLAREFAEIGVLESNDNETESNTDEVLRELKILQSALIPVNEYNTIQKKKVLALAKAEMSKQAVKKKLQELDAKVMEVYRMVASARRNKTMSKKLEDQVKRALRERKKLVEKLKNMS